MNAMIRGLKAVIALGALAGAGFALRWVTAGAMAEASTRDLISMAFVTVAAVAWTAYAWLLLAVVATALEQAPGVLGRAGAALAGRITSQTSRTLLRSALGVAAVTPLTIGVAHASPANPPQHSTTSGAAAWRATEPASTVRLDQPTSPNEWRLTEKPSSVRLADSPAEAAGRPQYEPSSKIEIGQPGGDAGTNRPTGPATPAPGDSSNTRTSEQAVPQPGGEATPRPGGQTTPRRGDQARPGSGDQAASRPGDPTATRGEPEIRVPDRPTDGAPVRYTDLGSGRHVVLRGESLWSIAAAELGAGASDSAVAARWPQWYAANRAVIGPDPDLLLPGQVLHSPPSLDRPVPQTPQEK
ncbi:LysM peptidoglycan-binding domain-containing protein [Kribbella sp. DT2]|uniref:LysM peptidoglycan-binding domain-containing protein n=1 Tax=Kribbella sp. DT2 TaxID=3393427 RepID=UPI003CF4F406